MTYSNGWKARAQTTKEASLITCVCPLQAETELVGTVCLSAKTKGARVSKEQEIEASLNELERLKNSSIASTRELAGSRAANAATR